MRRFDCFLQSAKRSFMSKIRCWMHAVTRLRNIGGRSSASHIVHDASSPARRAFTQCFGAQAVFRAIHV